MRLLIDGTALLLRSAGIKSYTHHWLTALRAEKGSHQISAFPFLSEGARLDHQRSVLHPFATAARIGILQAINHGFGPVLDLICSRYDIFHASNQVSVAPGRVKLTATIHDMTCWLMPELHTAANVRADQRFARRILEKADKLIAVSEHTRQDAIRLLRLKPEKIQVIHSGVGDRYFSPSTDEVEGVTTRLGLDRPYILALGTVEPRKNLDRLLDAYAALPQDLRHQFQLVVAGPRGWRSEKTVARLSDAQSGVRYLGYVAEADLPGLLAGATVFAYPSIYEGFGFPLAEAMAAGRPCLTSNVSSLPEVADGAAVLVDPRSTEEIRSAMARLLTAPSLRQELSIAARKRAEHFRWERAARESLAFFEHVAGY